MMKKLTKEIVVVHWMINGIEDFLFAFDIDNPRFSRKQSFFYAMGLEKICKSFLLASNSYQYEGLTVNKANKKIIELAKCWGHKISTMLEAIKLIVYDPQFTELFNKKYILFNNAKQLIDVIEKANGECRYPVSNPSYKKFPIPGTKDGYWDPHYSSDFGKLCVDFSLKIISYVEKIYKISISEEELNIFREGDLGKRFDNVFLSRISRIHKN